MSSKTARAVFEELLLPPDVQFLEFPGETDVGFPHLAHSQASAC